MKKFREDDAEVEIEFFRFRVKGDNSTITEAIRQAALVATSKGNSNKKPETSRSLPSAKVEAASDQQAFNLDDVEEGEVTETPQATVRAKRTRGTYHYKPLDFNLDDAKVTFEEYSTKKNPKTDPERYLVAVAWFKEHANLDSIKIPHVLCCFLRMKWDTPKDPRSCFRQLTDRALVEGLKGGSWKLTHNGMSAINKM
jgi:hypothetical protein